MNTRVDEQPEPSVFKSIGGGRYEAVDCPTGRCPRVNVAELPYERQLDETDHEYAARLYERAQIATDIGNVDELHAIFGAMQEDIGIPEDGIHVPCRNQQEWLALAFLQGVHPDAWQWAEFENDPETVPDSWFTDTGSYRTGTLKHCLKERLSGQSEEAWTQFLFIGPDGYMRYMTRLRDDPDTVPTAPITEPGSFLANVYKLLAQGLGLTVAGMARPDVKTQFANLETTDPPMPTGRLILWEFENENAPPQADFGENIILAQNGPLNGLVNQNKIRGPGRQPSRRPTKTVGASTSVPRPTATIGVGQPPKLKGAIPQWLYQRFQRGNRNEARVLRELGLAKNTKIFESEDKDGNKVKVIPDSAPNNALYEIKDRKIIVNNRQLQGLVNLAISKGIPLHVVVGKTSHITKPAYDNIRRTGGDRLDMSGLGAGDRNE